MYAVVDIETTGGHAVGNRVIEIAIFRFDGEKIVGRYQTLINPEERLPGYITSLTGITDDMVECAPTFKEIADEIAEALEGCIFVAHNVNFDYTFLKKEFQLLGKKFDYPKLCTVRLSRTILPGHPSYSLGNLCGQLGIEVRGRHRAEGDAEATVKLMKMLLDNDTEQFIAKSLKKNSRETLLPAHLPREQFDALPEEPGVYFFHNHKGKVIYVGKAINLKKRVVSHFSGKQQSKQSQNFMKDIHGVSFELCGSELIALLKESYEIKKHWPMYNRSQKRVAKATGIYQYEDASGYQRLAIGTVNKFQQPLFSFRSQNEARDFLSLAVEQFGLCSMRSGLHKISVPCLPGEPCSACHDHEKPERYNKKVERAVMAFEKEQKTVVIKQRGRTNDEYGVVLMEKGRYLGYGFIQHDQQVRDVEELKEHITYQWDNMDVQGILANHR